MKFTIEQGKSFIEDAKKAKLDWESIADKSWSEIKKRQKNGKLWSVSPNSLRKRARYPGWYSIFKIRQPLHLSRVGIPICKDTTQDGNDGIGATAAVLKERLATNLPKTFDFFDVLSNCRDDALATNAGFCRAYYECKEVTQPVKEYLQQEPDPNNPKDMVLVDGSGNPVQSDNIKEDDEGFYIEHDEVVDVENEKVFLEHVLYRNVFIDPDITRFSRCKRVAFLEYYSEPEFKMIFGSAALAKLKASADFIQNNPADQSSYKRQGIGVYEYWDIYEKDCYWWPEHGDDLIQPQGLFVPDPDSDEGDAYESSELNGLYNLEKHFPMPKPLMWNQPTDEFWPVCEYYQLIEIFEDIHSILSRMMMLTKVIRTRMLYDSSVEAAIQPLINETGEADAIGVTNLAQSLAGSAGQLQNVIQYFPIDVPIKSLAELYTALQQRLLMIQQLTGTGDLIQGMTASDPGKTFGERQIEEKYALNQSAESQRKMQEFVVDCYELLVEMALKNFKDASLEQYIIPQTLPPEHAQRYSAALGMLKEDNKRFRIELQTDSTLSLNERYDQQMRTALVNTLTAGIEKTASAASTNPPLAAVELHALKFLIQGFRQGKMFQDEITQAIDQIIQQLQEQKPPFDKDMAKLQVEEKIGTLKAQALEQRNQVDDFVARSDANREDFKVQLLQQKQQFDEQMASLQFQLQEVLGHIGLTLSGEREQRLEEQLAFSEQRAAYPNPANQPQPPNIIVVPTPSAPQLAAQPIIVPQPAQTIINAPPSPGTTNVVQPVEKVPVPILPGGGGIL